MNLSSETRALAIGGHLTRWESRYITVRVRKKSNLESIFQIFSDSRHGPLNIKVILSISHYCPSIIARFLYVVQQFFEKILELIGFEWRVE